MKRVELTVFGVILPDEGHISRDFSVDELMLTNYYRRKSDKTALRKRLAGAGLD